MTYPVFCTVVQLTFAPGEVSVLESVGEVEVCVEVSDVQQAPFEVEFSVSIFTSSDTALGE